MAIKAQELIHKAFGSLKEDIQLGIVAPSKLPRAMKVTILAFIVFFSLIITIVGIFWSISAMSNPSHIASALSFFLLACSFLLLARAILSVFAQHERSRLMAIELEEAAERLRISTEQLEESVRQLEAVGEGLNAASPATTTTTTK